MPGLASLQLIYQRVKPVKNLELN